MLNNSVASCVQLVWVSLLSTESCHVNVTFMDKVNLKYVLNSSSSHNNNNSINSNINNNPNDALKVVKTSPLQDFLMKFARVKKNSVINIRKKKSIKIQRKINID